MRSNLKIWILLSIACMAFVAYSLWGPNLDRDYAPKKIDLSSLTSEAAECSEKSSVLNGSDSLSGGKVQKDTTGKHILFFGDSMLEGLSKRFIQYAVANGHDLNVVLWYSSSTELYARTDTLQYFMRKYNPDYIVICLGSNELFVRDLDNRKKYIASILDKIGDVPYIWISPPNWKEDTGINAAIVEAVGKDRYFDSTHLTLARGRDHAHPTFPAAAKWMDLVAQWMSSDSTRHPIKMEVPADTVKPKGRYMNVLMPYNQ